MSGKAFQLADLFEIVVDVVPERLALVAGPDRRTYGELDGRANRLAHHLFEAGVAPGDHVAVYAWNRAEWLEVELAIYKARASVINVNYRYVADELGYMLENSESVALVFERAFAPLVQEVRAACPKLRHLVVLDDGSDDDLSGKAVADLGAVPYEDALDGSSPRARLRAALPRRPLRPVHRRDHGHAQGSGVAPGGHLLRGARGWRVRPDADHDPGGARGARVARRVGRGRDRRTRR